MTYFNSKLDNFLKTDYKNLMLKFNKEESKRLEFKNRFPRNQIKRMQLDDYVVGKGKESFCYWLETKLGELGSIKGGSFADKKFGVYYSEKESTYKTLLKWDSNLKVDVAFENIKNAIIDLVNAGEKDNISQITRNPISPMFKSKILTTYYPEKYLNIFSQEHVDYFIEKLNISKPKESSTEEKRQLLIEFKLKHQILKKFNNYIFMAFLYKWSNPKFKEIRILPMSNIEFPNMTNEEVQNKFFLGELIEKCGEYYYRKSGMNATKESLVLFQFNNMIIASAKLLKVKKFNVLVDGIYKGAYYFNVDTIKVFEPITYRELFEIDNNLKRFSQSKQKIDSAKQDLILSLINSKIEFKIPEEIVDTDDNELVEGLKKQIIVNAYERSSKAREECIKIHGCRCAICGIDFGEEYGEQFSGKIHVHHKKPLNEIDNEYEVNPETDLIPVCPNCHMILHSKVGRSYTVEEVKEFIKKSRQNR